MIDILHGLLTVQHGLPQVGDAPPLGNVETKQGRQFLRRLGSGGISPGPERFQLISIPVEGQISVHHAGDAHSAHGRQRNAKLFPYITL